MAEKIKANLAGERISSNSIEATALFSNQRFGEKIGEKIFYSLQEAMFLVETQKMDLFYKDKKLSEKELLKKMEKIDKKFLIKYLVFKDLRNRGYIVKSALKFGTEFRVYDKGADIGQKHARWILTTTSESEKINWHDFTAKNRVAHSTQKKLLIGIVDEEGDVSYYETSWTRP